MSVEIGGPFCGASGCKSDDDVQVVYTDEYGKRALCADHRADFPNDTPHRDPARYGTLSEWLPEEGETP